MKDREKERNRNEASTTYATPNATRRGNPESELSAPPDYIGYGRIDSARCLVRPKSWDTDGNKWRRRGVRS